MGGLSGRPPDPLRVDKDFFGKKRGLSGCPQTLFGWIKSFWEKGKRAFRLPPDSFRMDKEFLGEREEGFPVAPQTLFGWIKVWGDGKKAFRSAPYGWKNEVFE